jgi:hypothetical protein
MGKGGAVPLALWGFDRSGWSEGVQPRRLILMDDGLGGYFGALSRCLAVLNGAGRQGDCGRCELFEQAARFAGS